MTNLQLFAVTEQGVQRLAVPAEATDFNNLYDGLPMGVYSALRTYGHNKFMGLEAHLERTERSMALLGWSERLDRGQLRRALHEVCTAYPLSDARVRFDVLAAPATQLGTDSRVLIALLPLVVPPQRFYEEGVAVGYAQDLVREQPLAKRADFVPKRRHYVVGSQEHYEYLLLDEAGHILEGTGSNFYGVRDGVVYTAGEGVLEGITRKLILDLLPQLGIPVRLEAVQVDEVSLLDEAALSGSSRAFLPVVAIAGQVVGNGRPGPISQRILAAYCELVEQMVKTAI
ncbi:MAG: aminotransferase class IV [Ardenticatenaceae bacterium]|nr:aminotransferase class IV [Ardenticatenaceae bacterium]